MVPIITIQVPLRRQDRQPVDHHALGNRRIPRVFCRPAAIIGAVAGNVDHPPRRAERGQRQHPHPMVDRPADRGAAAEQGAWRPLDPPRQRDRRGRVGQPGPGHRRHLQARPGPLEHHHRNRAGRARTQRLVQPRRAERIRIALALQHEAFLGDAAGGIDGQHQQQVHLGLAPSRGGQQQQGGEAGQPPPPHLRPRTLRRRAESPARSH
jgi:hypothetical protein